MKPENKETVESLAKWKISANKEEIKRLEQQIKMLNEECQKLNKVLGDLCHDD